MLKNITKLSCLAASISMLIACGGGGSKGDNGYVPPPSVSPTTGRAVDGPLAGSTVTFIDCENKTTETDSTGNFTFPENCSSSRLSINGGIDIATDLPFTSTLTAPISNGSLTVVITPITTLITTLGTDQANTLAVTLGLNGVNLLSADPTRNKVLYAKTVSVQQLVEEIVQAIAALGGNVSAEDLNKAAFEALANALKNAPAGSDPLQNTAIISAALSATLDAVKSGLPEDIQQNLDNVKANLSSLIATSIANHIRAINEAIMNMTFNPNADNTQAIKNETKTAIAKIKEAIDTEKAIALLGIILTLDSDEVAPLLQSIATALNASPVDVTTLTSSLTKLATIAQEAGINISVNEIVDEIKDPNSFFTNYIKLSGFAVGNTVYTPSEITASATTPIVLPSLDNLFVSVAGAGSYANTTKSVGASLTVASKNPETVTVKISEVVLAFGSAGALSNATIPAGATLSLTSQTRNASFKTSSVLNVYQNGSIALNLATLQALLPSHLESQLTGLAPKGTTIVTATISAGSTPVAYDGAGGSLTLAPKFGSASGVVAKFALPE